MSVSACDLLSRPPSRPACCSDPFRFQEYLEMVDSIVDSWFDGTSLMPAEQFYRDHLPAIAPVAEQPTGALETDTADALLALSAISTPSSPAVSTAPVPRRRLKIKRPACTDSTLYELDDVRAHRGKGRRLEFFVAYKGYKGYSWQPLRDFVFDDGAINELVLLYAARAGLRLAF